MEQRALNFCARVLLVCKYGPWQHVSVTLPALLLSIDTCLRILNCRQCAIGLNDSEKRIQAFETKCMRKLLPISYLEHKTNDRVWSKINFLVGLQEPLLESVKRQKLAWFWHVTRHNSLSKTILWAPVTLEGG